MDSPTSKKPDDDDTLDLRQTAKAVQDEYKRKEKTSGKPKSKLNSLKAHTKWLQRQRERETLRQQLKTVWNKNKKI